MFRAFDLCRNSPVHTSRIRCDLAEAHGGRDSVARFAGGVYGSGRLCVVADANSRRRQRAKGVGVAKDVEIGGRGESMVCLSV